MGKLKLILENENNVAKLKNDLVLNSFIKNDYILNGQVKNLIYYTFTNLGYSRENLPQINLKDISELIEHFNNLGVGVENTKIKLCDLRPAQKEINYNKIIKKIYSKNKFYKERTFICSNENILIDGHHDFANGLEDDINFEVNVYKINLPIKQLIKRVNMMKISNKKNILDKIIESYGYK